MDTMSLLSVTQTVFGFYIIAWAACSSIIFPIMGYGSLKYIIHIDKQLAKDLNKYYTEQGLMKPRYMLSSSRISRFGRYCLAYPFIWKRARTASWKFKLFMIINSIGMWGMYGVGGGVIIYKWVAN